MIRIKDKLIESFPETFGRQWDQIVNGRSNPRYNRNQWKLETLSNGSCRSKCALELPFRVAFIPFDAIGRTIYSSGFTLFKVAMLIKETPGALFKKNRSEADKNKWHRTKLDVVDGVLATGLSPFQGIAKACRLAAGVLVPSTLYVHPENQPMRHRLSYEMRTLKAEVQEMTEKRMLPKDEAERIAAVANINSEELIHFILVEGFFDFACRWNLFDTSGSKRHPFFGVGFHERTDLAKVYRKMPLDNIQEECELLQAFKEAFERGPHPLNSVNSLNKLLSSFKSEKQKQVLDRFFQKEFSKVWVNSAGHKIFHSGLDYLYLDNDKVNPEDREDPKRADPVRDKSNQIQRICYSYVQQLRKEHAAKTELEKANRSPSS